MGDYDEECGKWIKLLLDLVVYNDATALQCIKLFTDPQSEVFQYFGTNIIIPRVSNTHSPAAATAAAWVTLFSCHSSISIFRIISSSI